MEIVGSRSGELMELGRRLEENRASELGWIVWALVGVVMVTFGGFVIFLCLDPESAAGGLFGLIFLILGSWLFVDSVFRRRGSQLDLHEHGLVFSSGRHRVQVRAGEFTVLSAASFRGMAPTMQLVENETRIRLPTHWFPDGWQLSERISALETPSLTRSEISCLIDEACTDSSALDRAPGKVFDEAARKVLAKAGAQLKKDILGCSAIALGSVIFGCVVYGKLKNLELGLEESVELWAPIALLYNLGGFALAMLPFPIVVVGTTLGALELWRKYQRLRSRVGGEAIQLFEKQVAVNAHLVGQGLSPGARFASLLLAGITVSVLLFGGIILVAVFDR